MVREGLTAAETPFQRFVANYFESRVATVAFFVLVVILILGFFAPSFLQPIPMIWHRLMCWTAVWFPVRKVTPG
ncbi:MAG: hypothetical protein CM15mP66_07100 [Pseudomonadota bacterium]|nr:MAG: hypothetical protein CM15mP66_07100 [Pseudomonadota bacterium]